MTRALDLFYLVTAMLVAGVIVVPAGAMVWANGFATAPLERLASFQIGSPVLLRIHALEDGGFAKEAEYHRRFAAHRLHGEWFEPHADILAEIARISHPKEQ